MKPPILFNRIEAANAPSVIGSDAVDLNNPTYQAVKWGNGAYISDRTNAIYYPGLALNTDAYTISFIVKTDWNMVNGVSDDTPQHIFWCMHDATPDNQNWIFFDMETSAGLKYYEKNNNVILRNVTFKNNDIDWAANTPTHITWMKDRAGIDGGSNILRMYINSVSVYTDDTAINAITNNMDRLYLFREFHTSTGTNYAFEGAIDNIKIWDYAKTDDFSDVYSERGGLNDFVITV